MSGNPIPLWKHPSKGLAYLGPPKKGEDPVEEADFNALRLEFEKLGQQKGVDSKVIKRLQLAILQFAGNMTKLVNAGISTPGGVGVDSAGRVMAGQIEGISANSVLFQGEPGFNVSTVCALLIKIRQVTNNQLVALQEE
ncbi:MAG: hypothetical protein ABIA92_02695 [Patescibacteria group bacterium]